MSHAPATGLFGGFAFILVLFILLAIIGSAVYM
ncbi:YjcZ family sporulation protein [Evansella sp. AB-P1]|nr:YjcZ family sporulation protein [Evansella sp. AB-P1]MDG5786309.1 YjcZ family sporulation protein [Evansella sp. AB-P1]